MIECAVIGGGCAGLAAAVRLARAGVGVVLFEARLRCGGRAASYADAESGTEIDNGQHLMMGCYRATLAFLREIGAEAGVARVPRLRIPFAHADGRRAELAAGALPYPFSIAQGFLSYRMLSLRERLGVFRVARALRTVDVSDDIGAEAWLRQCGQGDAAIEYLWRPMVLATMNAEIGAASARLFSTVLREIFLRGAEASALVFPDRPLSALYADPAVEYVTRRGGEVNAQAAVEHIASRGTGGFRLQLRGGAEVEARILIPALPPWSLESALEPALRMALGIDFNAFRPSEILSIHLWTAREFAADRMTGLLGTRLQWVFPKGICPDGSAHTTCTISASETAGGMDEGAIRAFVSEELAAAFSAFDPRGLRRMKCIRERRATFLPAPGMEARRPPVKTAVDGLFLAGDWTDTGLPATIESAVRSGGAAAEAALRYLRGDEKSAAGGG